MSFVFFTTQSPYFYYWRYRKFLRKRGHIPHNDWIVVVPWSSWCHSDGIWRTVFPIGVVFYSTMTTYCPHSDLTNHIVMSFVFCTTRISLFLLLRYRKFLRKRGHIPHNDWIVVVPWSSWCHSDGIWRTVFPIGVVFLFHYDNILSTKWSDKPYDNLGCHLRWKLLIY